MSREDFISDKLVGMSERFRQNAARNTVSASSGKPEKDNEKVKKHSAPAVSAPTSAPASSTPVPAPISIRTPALPGGIRSSTGSRLEELERMRRDLAGRLNRDLAEVNATIAIDREKIAEFEKYQAVLDKIMRAFEKLGAPEEENLLGYNRDLESMRIEYFSAAGRISAYTNASNTTNSALASSAPPPDRRFRIRMKETLPLGIYLFLSAGIIALALLAVFH